MKRVTCSTSEQVPKRRKVTVTSFCKLFEDFDKELKTVTWLVCESQLESGKKVVKKLKCSICTKFQAKVLSQRNFSDRWIVGADFVQTSNIHDHVQSDKHEQAMCLLKRESAKAEGRSCYSYAPIAKTLSTLPTDGKERVRKKFDIACFVARELSFWIW